MKVCPGCGQRFPDDANFCPMDAARLRAEGAATGTTPPPSGTIGRFRLIEKLESRAAGDTWRAEDATEGQVWLTLVAAGVFPTPLAVERAQREMRQLQRVTAGGVARIIDLGRGDDGRLYVVTEALAGETLRARVTRDGRIPLAEACRIVGEMGEALAEAQKVGVVHRDVSPDNVFLSNGQIKVTNFSIAEPIADQVFGTPAFLSPEQATGKPADQRSNIYALAALLYYLVSGKTPFEGSVRELLEKHQGEEPLPIAQRVPGIPPQADALMGKAMAKNPGRRHLTLRQFLKEVQDLALVQPVSPVAGEDIGRAKTLAVISTSSGFSPSTSAPAATQPQSVAAFAAPRREPQPLAAATPRLASEAHLPAVSPAAMVAPPMGAAAASVAGTLGEGRAVVASHEPAAVANPVPARPGAGGGFRETMWFFKGEQASTTPQSGGGEDAPATVLDDERPIDDRYRDDGTMTADGQKLSLKSGHTQMMKKIRIPKPVHGDRMSEEEFLREMEHKGRIRAIAISVVLGLAGLAGLIWLITK